jgi:DNA-binding MarR family transcriptional regulator
MEKNKLQMQIEQGRLNEVRALKICANVGLLTNSELAKLTGMTQKTSHKVASRLVENGLFLKKKGLSQGPYYGVTEMGADFVNAETGEGWAKSAQDLRAGTQLENRRKVIDFMQKAISSPEIFSLYGKPQIRGMGQTEWELFEAVITRQNKAGAMHSIGILRFCRNTEETINRIQQSFEVVREVHVLVNRFTAKCVERAIKQNFGIKSNVKMLIE